MKMLKKLLAVVLTGAMALTLLTACGSNAVTEKDIADAMNDMAKAAEEDITFTPRAKEREMAKAIAALSDEDLNGFRRSPLAGARDVPAAVPRGVGGACGGARVCVPAV